MNSISFGKAQNAKILEEKKLYYANKQTNDIVLKKKERKRALKIFNKEFLFLYSIRNAENDITGSLKMSSLPNEHILYITIM